MALARYSARLFADLSRFKAHTAQARDRTGHRRAGGTHSADDGELGGGGAGSDHGVDVVSRGLAVLRVKLAVSNRACLALTSSPNKMRGTRKLTMSEGQAFLGLFFADFLAPCARQHASAKIFRLENGHARVQCWDKSGEGDKTRLFVTGTPL